MSVSLEAVSDGDSGGSSRDATGSRGPRKEDGAGKMLSKTVVLGRFT